MLFLAVTADASRQFKVPPYPIICQARQNSPNDDMEQMGQKSVHIHQAKFAQNDQKAKMTDFGKLSKT